MAGVVQPASAPRGGVSIYAPRAGRAVPAQQFVRAQQQGGSIIDRFAAGPITSGSPRPGSQPEEDDPKGIARLFDNPVARTLLTPLNALQVPVRGVTNFVEEAAKALPGPLEALVPLAPLVDEERVAEDDRSLWDKLWRDPSYGMGQITYDVDTGIEGLDKWLNRTKGFALDVLGDPFTYVGGIGLASKVGASGGRGARLANVIQAIDQGAMSTDEALRVLARGYSEASPMARQAMKIEGGVRVGLPGSRQARVIPGSERLTEPLSKARAAVGGRLAQTRPIRAISRAPKGMESDYARLFYGEGAQSAESALSRVALDNEQRAGQGMFSGFAERSVEPIKKQLRRNRREANRELLRLSETRGGTILNQAYDRLRDTALEFVRREAPEQLQEFGLTLLRRERYSPHILTRDAQKFLRDAGGDTQKFRGATGLVMEDLYEPSGVTMTRVFKPGETLDFGDRGVFKIEKGTVDELNSVFRKAGLGFDFYESDPIVILEKYINMLSQDVGTAFAFARRAASADPRVVANPLAGQMVGEAGARAVEVTGRGTTAERRAAETTALEEAYGQPLDRDIFAPGRVVQDRPRLEDLPEGEYGPVPKRTKSGVIRTKEVDLSQEANTAWAAQLQKDLDAHRTATGVLRDELALSVEGARTAVVDNLNEAIETARTAQRGLREELRSLEQQMAAGLTDRGVVVGNIDALDSVMAQMVRDFEVMNAYADRAARPHLRRRVAAIRTELDELADRARRMRAQLGPARLFEPEIDRLSAQIADVGAPARQAAEALDAARAAARGESDLDDLVLRRTALENEAAALRRQLEPAEAAASAQQRPYVGLSEAEARELREARKFLNAFRNDSAGALPPSSARRAQRIIKDSESEINRLQQRRQVLVDRRNSVEEMLRSRMVGQSKYKANEERLNRAARQARRIDDEVKRVEAEIAAAQQRIVQARPRLAARRSKADEAALAARSARAERAAKRVAELEAKQRARQERRAGMVGRVAEGRRAGTAEARQRLGEVEAEIASLAPEQAAAARAVDLDPRVVAARRAAENAERRVAREPATRGMSREAIARELGAKRRELEQARANISKYARQPETPANAKLLYRWAVVEREAAADVRNLRTALEATEMSVDEALRARRAALRQRSGVETAAIKEGGQRAQQLRGELDEIITNPEARQALEAEGREAMVQRQAGGRQASEAAFARALNMKPQELEALADVDEALVRTRAEYAKVVNDRATQEAVEREAQARVRQVNMGSAVPGGLKGNSKNLVVESQQLAQAIESMLDDTLTGTLDPDVIRVTQYNLSRAVETTQELALQDITEEAIKKNLRAAERENFARVVTVTLTDNFELAAPELIGNNILVHAEVARSLKQLRDAAYHRDFLPVIDTFTNLFKTYATLTPGFHVRNAMSAVFMNSSDGVPLKTQAEAARLFRQFRSAEDPWAWLGKQSDDVQQAFEAAFGSGIGGRYRERGVGDRASARYKVTERLFENRLTDLLGRRAGGNVEGMVRLPMALDTIRRGGTKQDALARVTRVHFDYSQVSQLDEAAKRLIPFWTFMSRNLPLQITQMWTKPRTYAKYASFVRNFSGTPEPGEPSYFANIGAFRFGDVKVGGLPLYLQPDLPFQRIEEDVMNVVDAVSGENRTRWLSSLNPLFTGPAEYLTGQDFYTGRRYDDERDLRQTGLPEFPIQLLAQFTGQAEETDGEVFVPERLINLVRSLVPVYDRSVRLLPGATTGGADQGATDRRIESYARFAGIPIRQLSPEQQRAELLSRRFDQRDQREMQAAMQRALAG